MLAEVIIENNEMKVVKYPKNIFKGKHWKVNIEPIEEIKDEIDKNDFISFLASHPVKIVNGSSFLTRNEANER